VKGRVEDAPPAPAAVALAFGSADSCAASASGSGAEVTKTVEAAPATQKGFARCERCRRTELPNGRSFACRAGRNVVREKWSGRIRDEGAGSGQADISSAILHFNFAPEKG